MSSFLSSSNTPSWSFLETSVTTFTPSFLPISPSAMPKLPEVASKTVCPCLNLPLAMASCRMFTAGLDLIEPASSFESNLPKTCRFLSARSILNTLMAHSFRSAVMSFTGVALATLAPSKWGTLPNISRLKRSSSWLSVFVPCNFSLLNDVHRGFIKY